MQQWSVYAVPTDWQLPIRIVDQNPSECQSYLPDVVEAVCAGLTAINQSVFSYGWRSDRTTITSNRGVVKQIETKLEDFEDLHDNVWPKIWLCPTARSLVGKERRGEEKLIRKQEARKAGVMSLPDPLFRETQRCNGLDVLSVKEGREVEDLRRPNGYPYEDVTAANKNASQR